MGGFPGAAPPRDNNGRDSPRESRNVQERVPPEFFAGQVYRLPQIVPPTGYLRIVAPPFASFALTKSGTSEQISCAGMKSSALSPMRVLIADDEKAFSTVLADLVRSCGHEVVDVVHSGLDAIRSYRRCRTRRRPDGFRDGATERPYRLSQHPERRSARLHSLPFRTERAR